MGNDKGHLGKKIWSDNRFLKGGGIYPLLCHDPGQTAASLSGVHCLHKSLKISDMGSIHPSLTWRTCFT